MTLDQEPKRRLSFNPLAVSVVAGILAFALLIAAGYAYSTGIGPAWTSRASAVVLPAEPVDPEYVPAYYETLSRGQMVTTIAELVRLGEFREEAALRLGLTDEQKESVEIEVIVVSDTAVVEVVATSADPNLAVAMADGVVELSAVYVADLSMPYGLIPVGQGSDNITNTGMSQGLVLLVFTLVALSLGVGYQQAVYRLATAVRRRRSPRIVRSSTDLPPDSEVLPLWDTGVETDPEAETEMYKTVEG